MYFIQGSMRCKSSCGTQLLIINNNAVFLPAVTEKNGILKLS